MKKDEELTEVDTRNYINIFEAINLKEMELSIPIEQRTPLGLSQEGALEKFTKDLAASIWKTS
jgi:hypothetical protein